MTTADEYRAALSVDDLASEYFAKAILGIIGAGLASSVVFPVPQHVIVDSGAGGGGLTDAELRATPVGVLVSNPTTNPETGLAKDATFNPRYTDTVKSYAALLSASGNTDIVPTSGKRIRVLWVSFVPNGDNTAANLVTVSYPIAGKTLYVGYAMAHWQRFDDGAVDEHLRINLANTQPVAVTIHYQEI